MSDRYAADLEQAVLGRNRTAPERAMGDPGVAVRNFGRWDHILQRFDSGDWRCAGAVVCTDCEDLPFVADADAHDLWHVEMAAHLDSLQRTLFA